jgi:RNA polymerase sigma factor (sigma-70 family)
MSTNHMGKVIQSLRRAASRQDVAGLRDSELLGRYLAGGDEAAFEALVRRHGTMVLAVCHRVLKNCHDAEDAFQATFLVLVRKAASIVKRETVGGWLYGVAYKTALKAKVGNSERRTKERRAGSMRKEEVGGEDAWEEMRPLIDQELNRLPDKYRVLILLCDLGGKTRKEAAWQLGWPEGTVSGRLARARALLAKRLARYGLPLAGVPALALSHDTALAGSMSGLAASTTKAAMAFAAGQASGGVFSVKSAALAEGVLKAMLMSKLKWAAVALVLMLAGGYGALAYSAGAGKGASPPENPTPKREPSPGDPIQADDKSTPLEKALKDLEKVYCLADGEDLKCVPRPFSPERKAYLVLRTGTDNERLYKGRVVETWKWNGKKLELGWGVGHNFDDNPHPLIEVIPQLAGVRRCEIEGDGLALLEARKISADFIIRTGAIHERLIEQLGVVLRNDLKTPVKLSYKEVEREVLVASGTFKTVAPLGDMQGTPLQLYGQQPIREGKWLKSGDDYRGMLNQLGVLTGRQVINEATDSPNSGVLWFEYDPTIRLDTKEDMKALLDRLTEQTGLIFKQEKRRVKVLFVEQTE